jgi:hypothetical protein
MVVASDIEAGLSTWLSAVTDTVSSAQIGKLPVLADFEVQPLNGPHYNLPIGQSQIAAPGTITVIAGVP